MLNHNDLLTPSEVAERLKVGVSWVYEKTRSRSQDRLPAIKLGRYLRFNWPDVCTWIEQHQMNGNGTMSGSNGAEKR